VVDLAMISDVIARASGRSISTDVAGGRQGLMDAPLSQGMTSRIVEEAA